MLRHDDAERKKPEVDKKEPQPIPSSTDTSGQLTRKLKTFPVDILRWLATVIAKYPNPSSWISVVLFLVSVVGFIMGVVGLKIAWLFSAAAFVLAFSIQVSVFISTVWKDSVQKALDNMYDYFRKTANRVLEAKYIPELLQYRMEYEQSEVVFKRFAAPLLRFSIAAQRDSPIVGEYRQDVKAEEYEIRSFKVDETSTVNAGLLRITNTTEWYAHATSVVKKASDLVCPWFVTSYKAWNRRLFQRIVRDGFVEPFYPVPAGWLTSAGKEEFSEEQLRELREVPWLEDLTVYANRQKMEQQELLIGSQISSKADEAWETLARCGVDVDKLKKSGEKDGFGDEDVAELFGDILCIWNPTLNMDRVLMTGGEETQIKIEIESTYRIWVERWLEEDKQDRDMVFRFEIPFLRPLYVEHIQFELANPQLTQKWVLNPPSVHSAFGLQNPTFGKVKQTLRWNVPEDCAWGTPFLPGHGVAFLWQERPNYDNAQ